MFTHCVNTRGRGGPQGRLTSGGVSGAGLRNAAEAGLFVWFLGAKIFHIFAGYGMGARIAAVTGSLAISLGMTSFINHNAGKLKDNRAGFIVTFVLMAAIYGTLAWLILNDLYNTHFKGMSGSVRGMVSNIAGWGIACVIGNAALLSIANFVDVIFRPEENPPEKNGARH